MIERREFIAGRGGVAARGAGAAAHDAGWSEISKVVRLSRAGWKVSGKPAMSRPQRGDRISLGPQ